MTDVTLHVGYAPQAIKTRLLDAIHRAEKDQSIGQSHITFESWEGLSKVLTGKRLALLRQLHDHPSPSIAHLARALERDYKRTHEDVEILSKAGLIKRSHSGAIQAAFDQIHATINLEHSAA